MTAPGTTTLTHRHGLLYLSCRHGSTRLPAGRSEPALRTRVLVALVELHVKTTGCTCEPASIPTHPVQEGAPR
jgi:hypothetical protein